MSVEQVPFLLLALAVAVVVGWALYEDNLE